MLVNPIIGKWKATLAPSTAYHRCRIVAKLLTMLEQFGGANLADQLPKLRRPQSRTVVASPTEITSLLREAATWQKLLITLAWQMGLRHAECYHVTPRSHNATNQTLTIQRKGGQTQTLPTTPDVEALLAAAGDTTGQEDRPYINILRGKDTNALASRASWWRLAKKANADRIRPHDLRRTLINATYNITRDLRAAQQIAGHQSLQSTVSYLAPLTPEELRNYQRLLEFHSEVKQ
jgi:integrase